MPDDVIPAEKTRRFLRLEAVQKRRQSKSLRRYLGKTVQVLAERTSSRNASHITGHSTCQKLVNFAAPSDIIGELVDVKITQIKANSLFGEAELN
jgi:tRNA-2-methylthio-N6-dimethylallyladenosine synthase